MKFGIIKERKNPPDRRVVFSPKKLEELDLMLDKKMEKSVLERGKTAWQEYKNGKTLTFNQLKQEFLK